jgi:hypothetical protein
MELLEFLSVRQNLSRVTAADQSGPELVKAHSTCTKIHYPREGMHKMISLILSTLLAKHLAEVSQGPCGIPGYCLPVKKCHAIHLRIQ